MKKKVKDIISKNKIKDFYYKFFKIFAEDIGIDLGTANTVICEKNKGIVISEPSVIAINERNNKIFGIGNAAKEMIGKTPGHINAISPLKDGVITEYEVAEKMLTEFLKKVKSNRFSSKRIVICVPAGVTHVEKRAVKEVAKDTGAKEVYLIEEPMAAAIGSGLDIFLPEGHLIVDIGGGTTEIAVISLGGVVVAKSLRAAGNKIDKVIINYVKKKHRIHIGDTTAENIKIKLGNAKELDGSEEKNLTFKISGSDVTTGLPKDIVLTYKEAREAIESVIIKIIEELKFILEKTPPELISDINRKGITITGGGALIKGLSEKIASEIKLPVTIAKDPINAVIRGIQTVIKDFPKYKETLLVDMVNYSEEG